MSLKERRKSRAPHSRAYRERVRRGRRVAKVEYDAAILDMLIALGWLRSDDRSTRNALGSPSARFSTIPQEGREFPSRVTLDADVRRPFGMRRVGPEMPIK